MCLDLIDLIDLVDLLDQSSRSIFSIKLIFSSIFSIYQRTGAGLVVLARRKRNLVQDNVQYSIPTPFVEGVFSPKSKKIKYKKKLKCGSKDALKSLTDLFGFPNDNG